MSQQYFSGSSLLVLKLLGFAGELCSSLWFYFPAEAQITSVEQNKKPKGCLSEGVYLCHCVCSAVQYIYLCMCVAHCVGGLRMGWTNLWGMESTEDCVCPSKYAQPYLSFE